MGGVHSGWKKTLYSVTILLFPDVVFFAIFDGSLYDK